MRIEVEPTSTAGAGAAAAELGRLLRRATDRLQSTGPTAAGAVALSAWVTTWAALRAGLLVLSERADGLAMTSQAAAARFRETERGVADPDGH